jgi:hypothetical protein
MRNVELHVMENNTDVDHGIQAGLLEIEDLDGAECAACFEDVGHIAGAYFPFAVALDDETQWLVCTECASNVLEPDSAVTPLSDIFDSTEEYDPLEFDE